MSSGSSGNIVDRIVAWLRGFLGSPQSGQRSGTTPQRQVPSRPSTGATTGERGTGDITEPLQDTTPSATPQSAGAAEERQVLPDLDDSESDYTYTGPGSSEAAGAATEDERLSSDRSDFEDAGGDTEPDEASYPPEGTENGIDEIHDAVGRHEEEDEDARIDTSRDLDFAGRAQEADNVPQPGGEDIAGVSTQDELTAFEGASSDEFAAGGYAPSHMDETTIEEAADTTGTDTPRGVPREEIESESAEDAFVQGDEAVTAPGQGDADTFTDAETGTTGPSRSATGNDVDEGQEPLGTTLEYSEDEESPFDTEAANLSAEGELGVIDEGAAEVTAESGTSQDSYADFPDTWTPESPDDTGRDDFAGNAYPSDMRVDRLDGDDAFAADRPDIGQEVSSEGDLEVSSVEETLTGEAQGTVDTGEFEFPARALDQEMVGTSDEHVGGEEPGFVENMQDVDVPAGESPGDTPAPRSPIDTAASSAAQTALDESLPAGAVRGDGTTDTPPGYPIKGNASSKIYHLPSFPSYRNTKAEFCFATEQDAIAAGYRAPGRRNRGRAGESGSGADSSGRGESSQESTTIADAGPSGIDYEEPMETASATASEDAAGGSTTQVDAPAGAVAGDGSKTCPPGYPVKGNASSMIYHLPGRASYDSTVAEWCFATEEDALNAGYRAPKR